MQYCLALLVRMEHLGCVVCAWSTTAQQNQIIMRGSTALHLALAHRMRGHSCQRPVHVDTYNLYNCSMSHSDYKSPSWKCSFVTVRLSAKIDHRTISVNGDLAE